MVRIELSYWKTMKFRDLYTSKQYRRDSFFISFIAKLVSKFIHPIIRDKCPFLVAFQRTVFLSAVSTYRFPPNILTPLIESGDADGRESGVRVPLPFWSIANTKNVSRYFVIFI